MTGLSVQQTNRRMCRYVFVMFIFLCRPQDVYVQGEPSVSCEAGEVTVGERANITCVFPADSITPGNGNFIVKKFTASSNRDETDIMNCFHLTGSASENPECIFPNTSLGYNFAFVPKNDRQTVVIPSAKLSDAGEYGCDRIGHMVARCILTVQEKTTTAAPKTTATSDRNAISTDEDSSKPTSDSNPGAIIGIVIGILLGVGLLGGAAYFVWRFKCMPPSPPPPPPPPPIVKVQPSESRQNTELVRLLPSPETNGKEKPDVEKPATDSENPSKPGKGGDRNSKDSTDASGKVPATDIKKLQRMGDRNSKDGMSVEKI